MKQLIFLFCLSFFFAAHAQPPQIDVRSLIVNPKHYVVAKTDASLVIDGKADEKAWEAVPFTDSFIDIEGKEEAPFETKVKMLWDDEFLYVYAYLEEKHIWGNLTERDAIIFFNNDFEVFLDPAGRGKNYGEVEINALGTVWDLCLDEPYRTGGKGNSAWDLPKMKTALHIEGTVNDPSDIDEYWSVEMAIPLKPFIAFRLRSKKAPQDGELWRLNFSRVQWQHDIIDGKYRRKEVNGKRLAEKNWVWSKQGVINMHEPEKWGYLQFSEQKEVDDVAIYDEPEALTKQIAFALFRETRWGSLKELKAKPAGFSYEIEVTYGENKSLAAHFQKTHMGFEYLVKSPDSEATIVMNEEGEWRRLKNSKPEAPNSKLETRNDFIFATWARARGPYSDSLWAAKFEHYKSLGITDVLVGASPETLQKLVNQAKPYDIHIHAWMWTLNRPGDSIAMQHPDWYAVNRKGQHSLEYKAYVNYYQWLSPFHPDAREHIKNNVRKLTQVEGLASIHLDYVRYIDVILGRQLQSKYGLVQDREMPEYDYGYHPLARAGFKEIFGYDPLDLDHPELSAEWRQYRLNAITTLVNELSDIAHQKGHQLTAAVFPFPEMSRTMVRQAWDDWKLDAAFPMLYNNFYNENVNWIGFAAEQGVNKVDFPVVAGLFSPALKDPADLERAIRLAKEKGAKGVSIFMVDNMDESQLAILRKLKAEW